METFYRFLGGPRTFWGGSNKVIINNYGVRPMFPSMGRPVFIHHNCGGGFNRLFGFMAGMNLLSNIFGSFNHINTPMYNNYGQFGSFGQYNHYGFMGQNPGVSSSSLNTRLEKIENEIDSIGKQIEDMKKAGCDCNKEPEGADNTDAPAKPEPTKPVQATEETNQTNNTQQPDKPVSTNPVENSEEQTEPKTLDEVLNDIEDFNNLDNVQKDYVKKRIENAYTDENGNIKYDIKAIVHDGDTMASIINRFYTKEEQQKLNVAENDYNTQIAGQKIKNPASGDTIVANGVSEYGLKALIEDAKQGINRDGEIQKTNKKMNELKEAFKKGEKKLSKEYVLQNHLMTEAEYNKIIESKYSKN